jgi:uncharacterized repeat protein (TIGR03803 family)
MKHVPFPPLGLFFLTILALRLPSTAFAQAETILHHFGDGTVASDGDYPSSAPVLGADGNFYSVTTYGGTAGGGALYRITPAGMVTLLHNFGDGSLTNDGKNPNSLLLGSDGNFYGTTTTGGKNGSGTVFKLVPPTTAKPSGVYTLVYSFGTITSDGVTPVSVILAANGDLYGTTHAGGTQSLGTIFQIVPGTGGCTLLHSFGSVTSDGTSPTSGLVQGTDLNLYGTTAAGGTASGGTVFKITTGGTYTILHNFNDGSVAEDGYGYPSALVQGADGNFYGTTNEGGVRGYGTAYKITSLGVETILYDFGNTSGTYVSVNPGGSASYGGGNGLLLAADGNFYGTTDVSSPYGSGTIYKLTPQGVVTFLHNFNDGTVLEDGTAVSSGLAQGTDGNLYGTTNTGGIAAGYGTFFKLTLATPQLTSPVIAYGTEGAPLAYQITATNKPKSFAASGLPAGLSINATTGLISGTPTEYTSINGVPVTLTVTNASGSATLNLTVILAAQAAPSITSPLAAYGEVNSAFTYKLTASNYPTTYTASPLPAGLTFNATTGVISGKPTSAATTNVTVTAKNAIGTGTETLVISVSASTAPTLGEAYTVLYNFGNNPSVEDDYPESPLVQGFDGTLESITSYTIDNLTLAGTVALAHSFGEDVYADGADASGMSIIQAADGNFYGTTSGGGLTMYGTVFKMTPTGAITILHNFNDGTVVKDGFYPSSNLVQGTDGNLYGTTPYGGTENKGVIFRVTPQGVYSVLHDFKDGSVTSDGATPECGLIQGADGNYYGTTQDGGTSNDGTIYKMALSGGVATVTILHNFHDGSVVNDGTDPVAALLQGSDGNFYGTTANGGSAAAGTVFKLTTSGGVSTVAILHAFGNGTVTNDGANPSASLIEGFDGNLYGTTAGGGAYGFGTAFQIKPTTGAVALLHAFNSNNVDAYEPSDALLQASDGNFYGDTVAGGIANFGAAYAIVANQTPTLKPVVVGPTAETLAIDAPGSFRLLLNGLATSWSESGTLPPGLSLNTATGLISGNPTTAGTYSFSLTATNSIGSVVTPVTLTVVDVPAITSATSVTDSSVTTAISYQITTTGSPSSFGAGGLPSWLTLNPSTGLISGTPPASGVYTIYPTATNLVGTAEAAVVIAVGNVSQTITFPAIANQVYGAKFSTGATASSGLPITYTTSGPVTISGNTVTVTGVGTVTIRARQNGNSHYLPAPSVAHSFTVSQASQTISFPAVGTKSYGTSFHVSATASSGLAVTFKVVSGPATNVNNLVTITGVGTVVLSANQPGNADYTAAPQVETSFTASPAPQTITFAAIPNQTYPASPITLAATASSGLAVTYTSSGPVKISGNTLTINGTGSALVAAHQAGNTDYAAAPEVRRSFTVSP